MIEDYKNHLLKSTDNFCLMQYKNFLYAGDMELADRLKQLRESKGLTQEALSKIAGTTQQQIDSVERGISKKPRNIKSIATALGTTASWLQFGEGESPYDADEHKDTAWDNASITTAQSSRRIPVLNYIQAGTPKEIINDFGPNDGLKHIYTNLEDLTQYAFAMIVKGDSMTPEFNEGDEVIIDPEVQPRPGDYVAARCANTAEVTFKKYRHRGVTENGNELFDLVPLNDGYGVIHSTPEHPCVIIGTMMEHRRYRRR